MKIGCWSRGVGKPGFPTPLPAGGPGPQARGMGKPGFPIPPPAGGFGRAQPSQEVCSSRRCAARAAWTAGVNTGEGPGSQPECFSPAAVVAPHPRQADLCMNHNVPQAIEEGCCNGSPPRKGAPHAAPRARPPNRVAATVPRRARARGNAVSPSLTLPCWRREPGASPGRGSLGGGRNPGNGNVPVNPYLHHVRITCLLTPN